MSKYLLSISLLTIVLIITLLNIGNPDTYITLNFLVVKTAPIPGILVLYIGMIIGSLFTLPIIIQSSKNSKNRIINKQMKKEEKRIKKIKKSTTSKRKKNNASSNINIEDTVN